MNILELENNLELIKEEIDKENIWYRWNNKTYHIDLCKIHSLYYSDKTLNLVFKLAGHDNNTFEVSFARMFLELERMVCNSPEEVLNQLKLPNGKIDNKLNTKTVEFNLNLYRNKYPECFL